MKKLSVLGIVALALLAGDVKPASAWWPCFPLFRCQCKKYCQYNAFTPVDCAPACCGPLHVHGRCPITLNCSGPACGPAPCCEPSCYGTSCSVGCDSCSLGQLPPAGSYSSRPMPAASPGGALPNYQGPMPSPADQPRPMSYTNAPMPTQQMPYSGYPAMMPNAPQMMGGMVPWNWTREQ